MDNALEIRNLCKRYDGFALENVNISLPSGSIMGFIGENGAGKSTTIKLVLGLIHADNGQISVLGETNPGSNRALKEHIGVVMDETGFPDNLNIKDIGAIMKNCYKTWNQQAFESYTTRFSLPQKKSVKDYSRGMKMKLSIAVALSHDSRLLILDEATSGLDPIVRDEILDVFLEFIQDESHSIFISSHILSDLEKICDYITFIHKGKVIFTEAKDELLSKYVLVKCSESELSTIDKSAIVGVRKNSFGATALAYKNKVKKSFPTDPASIEDIMLYFIKEGKA